MHYVENRSKEAIGVNFTEAQDRNVVHPSNTRITQVPLAISPSIFLKQVATFKKDLGLTTEQVLYSEMKS